MAWIFHLSLNWILTLAWGLFLVHLVTGSPYLLFANRKDIRIIDAAKPRARSHVVVKDLEDAAALDFHYKKNLICWTEITLYLIRCTYLNGTEGTTQYTVVSGYVAPDGLAIDWINDKIYWSDVDAKRLEVANLDGSHRKVLSWEGHDQPRAIALVPHEGLMFWTDWGEEAKIERSGMNGDPATRQVIVKDDIFWPNGLTVDFEDHVLYWVDAQLKMISSVDFNGNNRQEITSKKLSHPFALTLYGDNLYWTDWQTSTIRTCPKQRCSKQKQLPGGSLSPMDIYVWEQDRQPWKDSPCQHNNGGCSHLCLAAPITPFFSCACPTGVQLLNSTTCANGPQELLLLVRRTDLRRISLDTPDYTAVVMPLHHIKHAIAIDYDSVERRFYWTDDEVRAISRAYLNGTGQEEIITTEVDHPDGVAIDWIARNIFWTDTGTDRIEVAHLNGSSRRILISDKLDEPRAIVVDPPGGLIYWTDWGANPKIERANMDGTERTQLIDTDLGWPNGMVVDTHSGRLFWGDAKTDKIEVAHLDGSHRQVLVKDQIPHTFGLTLLGDYLYWTDWQNRRVERVNHLTGQDRRVIIDQLPDLMGIKAVSMKQEPGWNPCAINNGNCSHLCLNRPRHLGYVCACPMIYELKADNRTCVVPEAFLLFSQREDIRRISLQTYHNDLLIPVPGVKEAVALDFHIDENRIYWSDTSIRSISRAFVNGSQLEHIIEYGLQFPEGMAVDWIAGNIYWTDMGSIRIEVARLDGSSRRVLVWEDIQTPHSVTVDPRFGYMYWSDWGRVPRIERASMDGSGRAVLVNRVGRANSLTIDFADNRLFWTDLDVKRIESSDLDGKARRTVLSEDLHQPFSLAQYQDHIYWTDMESGSIERAHKITGENRTRIQYHLDLILDIDIYHASRQSGWNPCHPDNNGCSHLCLALPINVPLKETYLTTCACPTHYSLHSDNKTCISPKTFVVFSQKNSVSRLLMDTGDCPDLILPVGGLRNVQAIAVDGVNDVLFWVDKSATIRHAHQNGTHLGVLLPNPDLDHHPYDLAFDPYTQLLYWSCARKNIINVTRTDGSSIGVIVGSKGEKPRDLAIHHLKRLLFWLDVGSVGQLKRSLLDGSNITTIISDLPSPTDLVVDVEADLVFWGDAEKQSIELATIDGRDRKVLLEEGVLHPSSLALHGDYLYWIDKQQNLISRINRKTGKQRESVLTRLSHLSDIVAVEVIPQKIIQSTPCAPGAHSCSHLCIISDEGHSHRCACPRGMILSDDLKNCLQPPACSPDKFACDGGINCIPLSWRCDGVAECQDQSDELECSNCRPGFFQCKNGHCLENNLRCNGHADCEDESDEDCCGEGKWACGWPHRCLTQEQVCDGNNDCLDHSDETSDACKYRESAAIYLEATSTPVTTTVIVVSLSLIFLVVIFSVIYMRRTCMNINSSPEGEGLSVGLSSMRSARSKRSAVSGSETLTTSLTETTAAAAAGYTAVPTNHRHLHPSHIQSSSSYDRNHVTGASSSSSSGRYGVGPKVPPPSPATVPPSGCCSTQVHSYRHYKSRNRPPPPTPCSTDVCDESDCQVYDYDVYPPPPPTPRSHYFSIPSNCPPSPMTEKSYYNPLPPPPSPVHYD